MKNLAEFCKTLKEKYKLKLKGDGPIGFPLGCSYKLDPDGTLVADPSRHIEKTLESYQRMFGEVSRKARTPLIPSDHPELDTTEFCGQEEIKHLHTLIGQLGKAILREPSGSFVTSTPNLKMPSDLELESQTILTYQTKTMIGPGQSMSCKRTHPQRHSKPHRKESYHNHICGCQPTS